MNKKYLAWLFCQPDRSGEYVGLQHNNFPVIVGETRHFDGELKICEAGLHASLRAIDALRFASGVKASGVIACLVQVKGKISFGDDILVSSENTVLAAIEASSILFHFARHCALSVVHLWDAPQFVRDFLDAKEDICQAAVRRTAWNAADTSTYSKKAAAASTGWVALMPTMERDTIAARAAMKVPTWHVEDTSRAASRAAACAAEAIAKESMWATMAKILSAVPNTSPSRIRAWSRAEKAAKAMEKATNNSVNEKQNIELESILIDAMKVEL